MDLQAEVVARIPAVRLKQLTNGQNPTAASSVNTAVLANAVLDAQTDFQLYAEQVYDGALQTHISIGVRGVVAWLKSYIGQDPDDKLMKDFHFTLGTLKGVTSRARIDPTTDSTLQPSPDPVDSDGVARPDFDRTRFTDILPRPAGDGGPPQDGFFFPE